MDKLRLHHLQFETYLGVYDWEQSQRQAVIIDLDLAIDTFALAQHDDITQAIDYTEIRTGLEAFLVDKHTYLLETLAQHIADFIQEQLAPHHLSLQVTKPQALKQGTVSVCLERSSVE